MHEVASHHFLMDRLNLLQFRCELRLRVFLIEKKFEDVLVLVGLYANNGLVQNVYHISIERPDSVSTIDSTPARVDDGAAACVMGNTLYAVGIGHA